MESLNKLIYEYTKQIGKGNLQKAAPEATEKISYQMPIFYLKGNPVHFATFKNHIGFSLNKRSNPQPL